MGRRINDAYYELMVEARHHTKLSQMRDDAFEAGFANGLTEALRIVDKNRGKQ